MFERRAQRTMDALNRRDLGAILALWDEDAVFEFPGRTPISGRLEGKIAIEAWWRRWVARYSSVRFTVRHVGIVSLRPRANSFFVAWDVEVTSTDGVHGEASGITYTEQRGGRIRYARDYFFDPTILERFWGRADDAEPLQPGSDPVLVGASDARR